MAQLVKAVAAGPNNLSSPFRTQTLESQLLQGVLRLPHIHGGKCVSTYIHKRNKNNKEERKACHCYPAKEKLGSQ